MLNLRFVTYWAAMLFLTAAMLTCLVALIQGWRAGHPFRGPQSVAYLSPLTNLFLGMGLLLSAATNVPRPWLRIAFIAAGLFQFFPAWKLWKGRQKLKAGGSAPAPSS